MGILTRLERRGVTWHPRDPALASWWGGAATRSGMEVTSETAYSATAVWAGVRVVADTLAQVPLRVREADRGRREARHLPLYEVLRRRPNPEQTSYRLRQMMQAYVLLLGNAYAEIVRDGGGRVRELWPIVPWRVRIERVDGELRYRVAQPDGGSVVLLPSQVLHVRGLSRDGLLGVDVLRQMQEAVGLGMAAEAAAGEYFGAGAEPGGVLRVQGLLSDQAYERLLRDWTARHQGVGRRSRVAILEEGTEWVQTMADPERQQLIPVRQFQVIEVARMLLVPPHRLMEMGRATWSNTEQMDLELVKYSIASWAVCWEQEMEVSLLTAEERQRYEIRHVLQGLMRGDTAARAQYYRSQWGIGAMSQNDIRDLEDMPPIEGGDEYWVPMNMLPLSRAYAGLPDVPPPVPVADDATRGGRGRPGPLERRDRSVALRRRTREAFRRLFASIAARLVGAETRAVRRAMRRGLDALRTWLDDYYPGRPRVIAQAWLPALEAYAEALVTAVRDEVAEAAEEMDIRAQMEVWVRSYADALGAAEARSSELQIRAILRDSDDPEADLARRMDEWDETRADAVAHRESVDGEGAFVRRALGLLGVTRLVWVANADACPLCREMDGRIVGIDAPFLSRGDVVDPGDGETEPLRVGGTVGHPGLHRGCECSVAAA